MTRRTDNTSERHDQQDPPAETPEDRPEAEESGGESSWPEEAKEKVRALEAERDEAEQSRLRALADFQNYQRRAEENVRRAREEGAAGVVRALLPVLDHFDLALTHEADQMTPEQLIGGIRMVRDELSKSLESYGVERVEPVPGEELDPNRHEAVMQRQAEDVEPGRIATVFQPGYMMGERVLRPAKVAVAAEGAASGASNDRSSEE